MDVLWWRRLELSLIRARGLAALERFLANQLEYCSYADHFAGDLERTLKDHAKEGQDPHSLTRGYAENEMGAVQQIKIICDYNRVYLHDSRLDLQTSCAGSQGRRTRATVCAGGTRGRRPTNVKRGNERKKVEMRFAHLKTHHGFERMRLRGRWLPIHSLL
jgi:hypothetical protein